MKKNLKITGMILLLIIMIYAFFIIEESVRLSNDSLAEPLIVFEKSNSSDIGDITYKSLGFTLITEYAKFNDSNDRVYPISQEFWLFDKFLVWGWIS